VRPVVLSVAGFDPSGGAGLQADCKTIEALGGWAASVVTAIVVQNSRGVSAVHPLPLSQVEQQAVAVLDDLAPSAVKSGVLADAAIVHCLARLLHERTELPLVIDPVGCATSGMRLTSPEAMEAVRDQLLRHAVLITPNAEELAALSGISVTDHPSAELAARNLCERGAAAVLAKGGHLPGAEAIDLLVTASGTREYRAERIDQPHAHGTGCVLASAIATALAFGAELEDAVETGKRFLGESLRHGRSPGGSGAGAVDPTAAGAGRSPSECVQ
jgi:hydroxymethylpyrimidine/phosphomethylpyrimidine kinase